MGSLEDRIRRLEASAGLARQEDADAAEARRRRALDKWLHEYENGRRTLQGLEPLPLPPELEDARADVLHTLRHVIPYYRERGGYRDGDGAEFLRRWEDTALEKLSERDKGDEQ
jgi:hypothetical protein